MNKESTHQGVEPLVTVKEVAEVLGCTEHTVYVNSAKGKLPSYKLGRDVKFLLSEIIAWRESKKRKSKFEIARAVDQSIFSHQ